MDARVIKSERWLWDYLYSQGKESRKRRVEYNREFLRLFPEGHTYSIRGLVRHYPTLSTKKGLKDNKGLELLKSIHPDAFAILADYGVDYRPHVYRKPAPYGEPEHGRCYGNALRLVYVCDQYAKRHPRAKKRDVQYVEGIAMGIGFSPMLHAWNARKGETKAIDWSWYATCKWARYLGIPLSKEEHMELATLTGYENLFEKGRFNDKMAARLVEILEARKTAPI